MEKISAIILFFFFTFGICETNGQEVSPVRKGLISTGLTICPSYMFADKQSYFYLHGKLEGYTSSKVSLSGEAFVNIGNITSDSSTFTYNHSVFYGGLYHFAKGGNDLYIGLQPGFAFTKLSALNNHLTTTHLGINPLVAPVVGYNFYLGKLFHFFIQTQFVVGQHNFDIHRDLAEIRFSAGLGINVNTIKVK